MPSLTDVAKIAGVSLTTASMVLNHGKQANRVSAACSQRIRAIADDLGYIPNYHARSMKLGRAEVIAVALDIGHLDPAQPVEVSELGNSYFGQLIGGIEVQTRNVGYQLTVVGPDQTTRAPDRGLLGIRQRRFDGLLVPGVVVQTARTAFMSEAPEANIVVIEYPGATQLPVVDFNDAAGVHLAVAHVAGLGHRNLLWVGVPETASPATAASAREQVFMQAVWDAGLRGSSCRPVHAETPGVGSSRGRMIDEVEAAVGRLLQGAPRTFTAVVCYNDRVAIGVCSALIQAGLRVPQDVSVIGFDDIEADLCIPRLTTISHKLHQMGVRATELVMEMIHDPAARQRLRGTREWVEPELVVRKSTGAVAQR